ncbi:uncharacterized protein [Physcomitrium patens]|uniref:DUF7963 domain-containing protein n=1 Tax=Physcomitrium patens TaxID=3218 RepID=A9SQU5_PHYPA|nr:uncharacterized protein LOC112294759 [Physcomitrium patens]XP_024401331.1 uncharacterized protein LOC112294759 [Physcomitrium patens]XP_024401332.1 uncharacterized protein LOC112294759 [Physcomitrium patens]PNR36058.1 hypothetical protein PHYPA_021908 [Physcomitrium patens]|eukprot:XP_024401330.1 uncharacterized protein LOC112294759 [Physcomitrella patens]
MASHEEIDLSAKALHKRYEGLVTVRSKAIKGKGAWYWAHLLPLLVQHPDTGLPKAVKLRCSLCNAMFSASNPSRTASEHLKRGTCPNFNGMVSKPLVSQGPGPKPASPPSVTPRKRTAASSLGPQSISGGDGSGMELARAGTPGTPLMLSGGKQDLDALALLEDSVRKLKSPGMRMGEFQGSGLPNKAQADAALNLLAEWLYESCGTVSFSCVEHPKFKAFLNQLGLPPVSRRYLAGAKLDAKFEEVKQESELKLREALFFQLASDGWKEKATGMGETLINITLNLPNGNSLFRSVVNVNTGAVSGKLVEETLAEAISSICGPSPERCVGIVADADRYSLNALEELEYRFPRMVNLCCQAQGFSNLFKDFNKHLLLFRSVGTECAKISAFFNNQPQARLYLHKYQREEYNGVKLLRTPPDPQFAEPHYSFLLVMLDDITASARALQHSVLDESFNPHFSDNQLADEVAELVGSVRFWSDLEAVQDLVKIVKGIVNDIEVDRPLVSQCLPLWDELRAKVKDWCARHDKDGASVYEIIETRFGKNYHPAWSAALILDPLYLLRDSSGKYLPPFRCLTSEQEKDVDRLITRLVAKEEAHIALMELMKWRAEGLDPLYAQAVQLKQRDPLTGRMKAVNPQSRRLVWETCLSEYKSLGKVAVRLLFLHATSCGLKCNWSMWRWAYRNGNSRLAIEKAEKMIFIASHAKLERRDFTNEEERDAELFLNSNDGSDEMPPDEVFLNASTL